jgi:hypothetical protein
LEPTEGAMDRRELDKKIAALEAKLRLPATEAECTKAEKALSALRSHRDEEEEIDHFLAASERWKGPHAPDWLRESMERADASAREAAERMNAGKPPRFGIYPRDYIG